MDEEEKIDQGEETEDKTDLCYLLYSQNLPDGFWRKFFGRKLKHFQHKSELDDYLNDDDNEGDEFDSEDRVICSNGQVFSLDYNNIQNLYDLKETPETETWDADRLLPIAIEDLVYLKKAAKAEELKKAVEESPPETRLTIILQHLKGLPDSPFIANIVFSTFIFALYFGFIIVLLIGLIYGLKWFTGILSS